MEYILENAASPYLKIAANFRSMEYYFTHSNKLGHTIFDLDYKHWHLMKKCHEFLTQNKQLIIDNKLLSAENLPMLEESLEEIAKNRNLQQGRI